MTGGGKGDGGTDYVEIRNISEEAITAADLDTVTLEVVGDNGNQVKISLAGVNQSIPAGGFLTVYQTGEFSITDGFNTIATGTWTNSPVGWSFGDDTGDALAVNLVEDGNASIDTFAANSSNTGGLSGGASFNGRILGGGSGQQAALTALASLLGVAVADLLDNEQFNGRISDQEQVLQALGIDVPDDTAAAHCGTGEHVFARVYGPNDGSPQDTNGIADWTTSDEPTEGAFNSRPNDFNTQDNNDDFDPRQNEGVNTATAGQQVLDTSVDGTTIQGGRGPDFLYGTDGTDFLRGGDHDDMLYGGGGADMLDGGGGADLLIGGEGADTLDGGRGDDVLVGGRGDDFFVFGDDHGDDIVVDFTKGEDTIAFDTTHSITSFGDLAGRISIDGGDTLIDTGDGNSIRLSDFTGSLGASDFMFGVPPCAPLAPCMAGAPCAPCAPGVQAASIQATSLPDAQPRPDDGVDAYYLFGNSGPQLVTLSDLGVTNGGDLVLSMDGNSTDGSRLFMVFKAGGEGVIDLAGLGDADGDGVADGANELALSFQDVMDLSEVTGGLVVHGRDGDAVSADLRGHTVANEDHGSFNRYVIDGGAAQIDIDKVVQQNIVTDAA